MYINTKTNLETLKFNREPDPGGWNKTVKPSQNLYPAFKPLKQNSKQLFWTLCCLSCTLTLKLNMSDPEYITKPVGIVQKNLKDSAQ